jgi:uncharacterized protein YqeY
MIDINKYIAEAMKKRERERLDTLKLIKAELVKAEKDGITLDDAKETKILIKMVEQRKDSISQYIKGGRNDLAEAEQKEIDVINEFIPEQPTDEDIEKYTNDAITHYIEQNDSDYLISMKDMKAILSMVQEKYPMANGKIVSKVLKDRING